MISKERMMTFFDAVLAIVMTILVLDLEVPKEPTLEGLWQMRTSLFAYSLSFFWLGTVWIQQVQTWHKAEYVSNACLWWCLGLLFFLSFVPFLTSFVADYPESPTACCLYILQSILITFATMRLNKSMRLANPDDKELQTISLHRKKNLTIDFLIKCSGFILAFLVPQLSLLAVFASLLYIIFSWHHDLKIKKGSA